YNNADPYKTILGPNTPFVDSPPNSQIRRRNAQREAVDIDLTDGLFNAPFGTTAVQAAPAPAAGSFATGVAINADGNYTNAVATFVNGVNTGLSRIVTGSTAATNLLNVNAFPAAPAAGDDLTLIARDQA